MLRTCGSPMIKIYNNETCLEGRAILAFRLHLASRAHRVVLMVLVVLWLAASSASVWHRCHQHHDNWLPAHSSRSDGRRARQAGHARGSAGCRVLRQTSLSPGVPLRWWSTVEEQRRRQYNNHRWRSWSAGVSRTLAGLVSDFYTGILSLVTCLKCVW